MNEIAIGKIRTSHGVKGFLKVLSFSGQTEHFLKLKEFVLKKNGHTKTFNVESIKASGSTVFVKLKGIESPEVGKTYEGLVKKIMPFGAFVEIMPRVEGLLHISEIEHRRIENVEDVLKEGDRVNVQLLAVERDGKLRLSRKALIPRNKHR